MSKPRWTIEQKRQHVAAWRASGLTRQQYCELNDIPFTSLREWPQDVAKAERRANEPTVLPVHIAPPLHADVPQPVTNEPVTLFLPDVVIRKPVMRNPGPVRRGNVHHRYAVCCFICGGIAHWRQRGGNGGSTGCVASRLLTR